jgi:hypothetical protein
VHVTNRTRGKVTAMFRVCGQDDDEASRLCFSVSPPSQDINPGKTVSFQVSFRPDQDDFYYCEDLECFAYAKKNRNFRLINEESFTPPWCATVKVKGNTFKGGEFLPKVALSLKNNTMIMPPCHLGDATYNTILLHNEADTPASFSFSQDPSGVIKTKPSIGRIMGNSFQLVCVEYRPDRVGVHPFTLALGLNNSSGDTKFISVQAHCFLPDVQIENNGMLYFKPTCLGIESR